MHPYFRRKIIGSITGRCLSGESILVRRISTAAWARKPPENADRMDKDSLYKMLWAGGEIGMKMSDVLELLKRERKRFYNSDLISCAKTFRDCRHFKHSVQLLEWIAKGTLDRSKGDSTVCLDIMYNLKGMAEVHKYLASLPLKQRPFPLMELFSTTTALDLCSCSKNETRERCGICNCVKLLQSNFTALRRCHGGKLCRLDKMSWKCCRHLQTFSRLKKVYSTCPAAKIVRLVQLS